MSKDAPRRSPDAQLLAMTRKWPDFKGGKSPDGTLSWTGPLKPKAKLYIISIYWKPGAMQLPYVVVEDPPLEPKEGATFEQIPHLIYFSDRPQRSGLCLFDPDGKEWTPADLIADTTVYWASEWLVYYELWHLTGDWLGPSIGYESVAHMNAAEARAIKELLADVH